MFSWLGRLKLPIWHKYCGKIPMKFSGIMSNESPELKARFERFDDSLEEFLIRDDAKKHDRWLFMHPDLCVMMTPVPKFKYRLMKKTVGGSVLLLQFAYWIFSILIETHPLRRVVKSAIEEGDAKEFLSAQKQYPEF